MGVVLRVDDDEAIARAGGAAVNGAAALFAPTAHNAGVEGSSPSLSTN
jgi:hypothetical protein